MMKEKQSKTKPGKKGDIFSKDRVLGRNIYLILAFFIPFLLMFVFFALKGVSPFGTKQILVTDLWHQYYPFLVDFQDKLQHSGSLFWTWHSGGGTNYLALISYYLASPLNFLSVFVPASALREFLYVITCIKIGCAGWFFALFLKMTFKKNDITITAFGVLYALCSFVMGYYWNVIWLDTIALLPLVIAGTFALLREGKFRLYIVTLALSVLANYYIGLFTCAFVVIVCVGYSIVEFKSFKKLVFDFLKVAGASIVGVMITAILTIPAYLALGHAHSADNSFPTTFAVNMGGSADFSGVLEGISKTIANSVALIDPTTKEGLPNVYCGVVCIVLGILFLTCKKIKVRERVFCGFILLFFMLSFVIRQLDYIWHGFHFPNMLPYRFSFLFSFVLIYMSFRVFTHIEDIKLVSVCIAVAGFLAVLAIAIQNDETKSVIATSVIGIIMFAWLFLYVLHIVPKRALAAALFIVAMAEAGSSAYNGINAVSVTDGSGYPLGTENTAACVEYVESLEVSNIDLERTEVTKYHTLNDDALNLYDGVSMFNSITNEKITDYMEKFGICGWVASNRYTYMESSPFTNLMLNVKYLISVNGKYLDPIHNDMIFQSSTVKLLENKSYIKQGFMTKEDLLDYNIEQASSNPIDNQNRLFRLATGLEGDLYEYLEVVNQGHTDYSVFPVNKNSFGNYTFSLKDSSINPHLKYNYTAPSDGIAVAYFSASGCTNVSLKINDSEQISNYVKRPYIMTFGKVSKGDKLSLYADVSDTTSGSARVYCAMFNEELFEKGLEILSSNVLNATKVTDTEIAGDIDVSENGLFYTSIPYVNGWKAYVDGKETEITPVGDAMLAFKLEKGNHSIQLKYVPEGFGIGLTVSLLGIAIFAGSIVISYLRKKRKTENEVK